MELKFKVGDKVRIITKEKSEQIKLQISTFAKKYLDKSATILEIDASGYYITDLDYDEKYPIHWSNNVFELESDHETESVEEMADKTFDATLCTSTKQVDNVSHPSHYTWLKEKCGIEVIDITRHMDFDLGNALKYILRSERKKEQGMSDKEKAIEDLEKAIFYIKDKIKLIKEQ